jgi:hypothetical protein
MEHLFFNEPKRIEEVSSLILSLVSADIVREGESANVFQGVYYYASIFGLQIRLELNSYDYEDDYNYMISIRKDYSMKIKLSDTAERYLAEIIAQLISKNLHIKVAREVGDELEVYV